MNGDFGSLNNADREADERLLREKSLKMADSKHNDEDPISDEELRPQALDDFIGQPRLKAQMSLFLEAAQKRNVPPDHILLAGPPGLGKTTLAMIVAHELNVPIRVTSGPAISHAGDLASILSSLDEGEVLFIDEIHRLPRPAEELMYIAMEDFRVDVMVGKGPGATSIPLSLPRFTVVGATTREGMLPSPLRARFGFTAHLDYYPTEELKRLIHRSSDVLDIKLSDSAADELSLRSRGTPRIANRLLRRVRDWAVVHDLTEAGKKTVTDALDLYQIDTHGLDRLDIAVLNAIVKQFSGGPVGLSNLAAMVGEEAETVETVCEPYLVREGFLTRTPRGRVATKKAWEHLGIECPEDVKSLF
ncbi:MAG: Holliday junction branch migration DNA helicase RuvB [Bifidobacteriaceae bacterium]|nr:Holliday junction branch migration DNA helicase RuvB [Bifidobacteriaceae bacterium]